MHEFILAGEAVPADIVKQILLFPTIPGCRIVSHLNGCWSAFAMGQQMQHFEKGQAHSITNIGERSMPDSVGTILRARSQQRFVRPGKA